MKKILVYISVGLILASCAKQSIEDQTPVTEEFQYQSEQFADLKILKYRIPDFDRLSLDQKKLVYYLAQAGLAGRDIMYDQNYRHNLAIRKSLENIVTNYTGDKTSDDWQKLLTYTKRVWFSNGIHHHYSMNKILPEFSRDYFESLLEDTSQTLDDEVLRAIFDPTFDAKKVNLDPDKGLLKGSAINFYDPDVTEEEVKAFYSEIIDKNATRPISYGLNSKIVRSPDGSIREEVWKSGGMYGSAIDQIIKWLEKATEVAENEPQKKGLELLISYYKTGDLKTWDDYNVVWAGATEGDIDYINSFIEVYNDPMGYRGSFESIVEIKDFEASERMQVLSENAQWFEDNSTIMDEHKKANVVGVSYKVVNVASEAGDSSPSTPIGVNLPNANWIRKEFGSKSVSLGNILEAYSNAGTTGFLDEFAFNEEEKARAKEYGELSGKIHTALHEVIGHASGQINEGVGTPKETLESYASTIEEGRADLVGLYFIMDQKLIDLGLIPNMEVAKAEYDSYIRNGLMTQLRRLKPGEDIEESHMRNRAWISGWAYEKGMNDQVIEKKIRDGKTYFIVNDYSKLRDLFGQLLRETQRIKSEGDYNAAKELVETYGVKVDPVLHQEVLERYAKLNSAPYSGFINPELEPVMDDQGNITDIKVNYPNDFTQQMLDYGSKYSFL